MIENLKEIEKIIKLARKHGVLELKVGEIELKLSDHPPKKMHKYAKDKDEAETSQPTDEEMLFWSTQLGAQ